MWKVTVNQQTLNNWSVFWDNYSKIDTDTNDKQFVVRLFLDKSIRKYFERKPLRGQTIIGEDKDGSIEIEIKISNTMEILPLILYYIPYIKVLEPQSLADEIKDRVQGYLKEI